MTAAERAQILVTARFLRATERMYSLATTLIVLSAAAMIFEIGSRTSALAAIALGLVSNFYGIRIAFDARLLEDVALENFTTSDLDIALDRADKAGRGWLDRCRGARGLVAICAAAIIAQIIAVVLIGVA